MRKPKFWIDAYLPEVASGMINTLKHLFFIKPFTIQYPEQKKIIKEGYRGEHRMKKDKQGRAKCSACFLCATVCPARCITIIAGASPYPDKEKIPLKYEIDELRCIYCGMCQEACPCDAIQLTTTYNIVSTSRIEKIYSLERLLSL
jgi:NADH-quinone oxidoreductase subunit I